MVAEMETCSSLSGYSQVGGEGSIFKGVKSINCCEDNATQSFNLDASWCTGSEGTSMEIESDTNTDSGGADVITSDSESHTESVEESHTEEHSESHAAIPNQVLLLQLLQLTVVAMLMLVSSV